MSSAPDYLRSQFEQLKHSNPEIWDDPLLAADMVEAETDAPAFMAARVAEIAEAEAFAASCDSLIGKYHRRKERLERRVEVLRALILNVLQEAELKNFKLATTTLSVRAGPRKVIVTSESELPDAYFRITRTPNLTAIKKMINQGVAVPGAVLSNAESVLSMT
jgi:hypothetical protein